MRKSILMAACLALCSTIACEPVQAKPIAYDVGMVKKTYPMESPAKTFVIEVHNFAVTDAVLVFTRKEAVFCEDAPVAFISPAEIVPGSKMQRASVLHQWPPNESGRPRPCNKDNCGYIDGPSVIPLT